MPQKIKEIDGSEDFSASGKLGVPVEFQPRNLFWKLVLMLLDKNSMHSVRVKGSRQTHWRRVSRVGMNLQKCHSLGKGE